MLAAGFIEGNENQIPKDQGAGHYGLAKEFIYLE
jgi:hypothetical protein